MWTRLRSWVLSVVSRSRAERDLTDEIEFHLRERAAHWVRQGVPAEAAARRARLEFGAVERHKEEWRQARGLRLIDELRSDLTYGLRILRASPAFTSMAVAILAVAIGANIAVFNVLDAVSLRLLPVERPRALRELAWIERAKGEWQMSYDGSQRPWEGGDRIATSFAYPAYAHIRDHATTLSELVLFTQQELTVGVAGRERRLPVLLVSGNFLRGLGVNPMVGRTLEPADDRAGATPVAVLTHAAWQRLFSGEPAAALGRSITINGAPAVVVGITPPAFEGVDPGSPIDLLAPITTLQPVVEPTRNVLTNVRYWGFRVLGRLKPGVDDERMRAEVDTLLRQAVPSDFSTGDHSRLRRVVVKDASQGLDSLRRNYSRPLYLLMAIMAAILLIACANIAGLLLARAAAREHEMGLRLALGAGRGRLVRQMLTESALLVAIGGTLGIALGLATAGDLLPLLNQEEVPITLTLTWSPWLTVFSVGLCLTVAMLCGMLPALLAGRGPLPALTRTMSGVAAGSRLFAGKTLIVLQVTMSLVLLVGAALFMRTLVNLRAQPLGFRPDHLLLFEIDGRASGYESGRLLDFYEQLLEKVAAAPGVRTAAFSRYALLAGGARRDAIRASDSPSGQNDIGVYIHNVSPRYFETMGIPLAGREFTAADRENSPRVAVVNRALARLLPGGGAAVGRRVVFDGADVEIVGMSADARFSTLRDSPPPTIYLPFRQSSHGSTTFAARTEGDPGLAAGLVRDVVEKFAPTVPLYQVRTQEAQIDAAIRQERLFAYAASAFAGLALLLACLGLYGTLAYSIARRAPEIGLRMALGADRWNVTAMVLRESLAPVLVGLSFGLVAAAMTTQVIESMLFGLTSRDAPTIAMATLALIVSAVIASLLPCWRASGIDPMTALRRE